MCDRKKCNNKSEFQIGLLIYSDTSHEPAEALMGLEVCKDHSVLSVPDVISKDEFRNVIIPQFIKRGFRRPQYELTKLFLRPLD